MVRVMDYEMMERRVPLWCRRATSRSMDPYSSPRKPVQCVAFTVNVCIRWISLHCLMTLTSRIQFVSFPGTLCVKRPTPNLESDLLIRRTQTIAKMHNARSNWASCRVQPSWLSQFTLLHTFLAEEVATPSYSPASMPTVGNACRLFANRAAPLMSHKWLNIVQWTSCCLLGRQNRRDFGICPKERQLDFRHDFNSWEIRHNSIIMMPERWIIIHAACMSNTHRIYSLSMKAA